jgi:hypothetical protein
MHRTGDLEQAFAQAQDLGPYGAVFPLDGTGRMWPAWARIWCDCCHASHAHGRHIHD